MHWIDISLPIYPGMIVYPGNPEVTIETIKQPTSTHSRMTLGSHTGTHIDAPRHVFRMGKGIDVFSLDRFIGPCRVLDCTHVRTAIMLEDLASFRIRPGERILLKTRNSRRSVKKFYNDFIALDGDAADFLADRGVVLVGIDALSIKKRGVPDHRPHTTLLKKGIVIVEGLDLSRVSAGRYHLVCLPLRLQGLDGAPVRALLGRI